MMKYKPLGWFVILGMGLSAGASARSKVETSRNTDPNKVICRAERSTGSRLASAKVCMTAREWEENQRLDRQAVEKIQNGRFKNE